MYLVSHSLTFFLGRYIILIYLILIGIINIFIFLVFNILKKDLRKIALNLNCFVF